jgi:hypothetical protein
MDSRLAGRKRSVCLRLSHQGSRLGARRAGEPRQSVLAVERQLAILQSGTHRKGDHRHRESHTGRGGGLQPRMARGGLRVACGLPKPAPRPRGFRPAALCSAAAAAASSGYHPPRPRRTDCGLSGLFGDNGHSPTCPRRGFACAIRTCSTAHAGALLLRSTALPFAGACSTSGRRALAGASRVCGLRSMTQASPPREIAATEWYLRRCLVAWPDNSRCPRRPASAR